MCRRGAGLSIAKTHSESGNINDRNNEMKWAAQADRSPLQFDVVEWLSLAGRPDLDLDRAQ